MLKLPEGTYSIIYADPPWTYKDKNSQGAASNHYETMSLDDIKAMPILDITNTNCVLFIWATYPLIAEALEVINAWGFTYKSVAFTWIKLNKNGFGYFFGLGRWTRGNPELCLIATKGKPQRASASVANLTIAPLTRHSAKPPIVRDKIVELMGDLPRIELFARNQTKGWGVWGNDEELNKPINNLAVQGVLYE